MADWFDDCSLIIHKCIMVLNVWSTGNIVWFGLATGMTGRLMKWFCSDWLRFTNNPHITNMDVRRLTEVCQRIIQLIGGSTMFNTRLIGWLLMINEQYDLEWPVAGSCYVIVNISLSNERLLIWFVGWPEVTIDSEWMTICYRRMNMMYWWRMIDKLIARLIDQLADKLKDDDQ